MKKIDKYKFINTIIGEGCEKMLREIFKDDEQYDKLIRLKTEEFEDVLVKKLNKMSSEELTVLAKKYNYDIAIFDN